MPAQDYRKMDSAPHDGTVVLVLGGSRKPRSAYWDGVKWMYFHSDDICYPDFWTDVPAEPPSDYLPPQKKAEDLLDFAKEDAINHKTGRLPTWTRGVSDKDGTSIPVFQGMIENMKGNTQALQTGVLQRPTSIDTRNIDAKTPLVNEINTPAKQKENVQIAAVQEQEKVAAAEFPKSAKFYEDQARAKPLPVTPAKK